MCKYIIYLHFINNIENYLNIILFSKFIYFAAEPIYLLVNNLKDVHKKKGHMPLTSLLKGIQIQKKRKTEENFQEII